MSQIIDQLQRASLREQVEALLPSWPSWYPSLFHAAEDLGLIRARVCAPSSLMLSSRHAHIRGFALCDFLSPGSANAAAAWFLESLGPKGKSQLTRNERTVEEKVIRLLLPTDYASFSSSS